MYLSDHIKMGSPIKEPKKSLINIEICLQNNLTDHFALIARLP